MGTRGQAPSHAGRVDRREAGEAPPLPGDFGPSAAADGSDRRAGQRRHLEACRCRLLGHDAVRGVRVAPAVSCAGAATVPHPGAHPLSPPHRANPPGARLAPQYGQRQLPHGSFDHESVYPVPPLPRSARGSAMPSTGPAESSRSACAAAPSPAPRSIALQSRNN